MNEITSVGEIRKDIKSFEDRILKNCTKVELFCYIIHHVDTARMSMLWDALSPWNKQHIKIQEKINEGYDKWINNRKKDFDIAIKSSQTKQDTKAEEEGK